MSEETSDRRKVAAQPHAGSNEPTAVERQIQTFVDEHPPLSLAFVVAAGYAIGRIISKLGT
jgi:hypothetical protein